ncbi:glycosyltransferase [bacterium]|nr:glycosyltransferase [candidate division CSSED10-310 bacterium]
MKVAIIHDWLTGMRGGERVLELFCSLFPDANLFTLFHHKGSVSPQIERHPITVSRLQRFPRTRKTYRYLLPLFPSAIESFDLSGFDLIISTSHAVAKGAIPPAGALSICYCHTPMRYIWDQYDVYFDSGDTSRLVRTVMPLFRDYLQNWDVTTHNRVNAYIANSRFVARRIETLYGRPSTVIPAPVDCRFFMPNDLPPEEYYLVVSALAPYKRVDLAIDAFNRNERRLVIIGDGTESKALRARAKSNITFMGRLTDAQVRDHYQRCRAVVFPGVEDFGLVPLEAQACGRPVIAYVDGGALETVVEGISGHFFFNRTPESLNHAIRVFETMEFSMDIIRKRAFEFDSSEIGARLCRYLNILLAERGLPAITATEITRSC